MYTLNLKILQCCLLKMQETKKLIPEMLYLYLRIHQNALSGRAPPRPAGGAYSAPHTL